MSWLLLATSVLLAGADAPTIPVVQQAEIRQVSVQNQGKQVPGLPEGVQPPSPMGYESSSIDPPVDEGPYVTAITEEIYVEEEGGDGFSLNNVVGLEDHGVSVVGSQIVDFSNVWGGGATTGDSATMNYFDLGLEVDTERFLSSHWTGGSFFFAFQDVPRTDATVMVGDAMVFDNIDLPESRTQLAEIFYEQWLYDEQLRIKVGKFDANNEFSFSDFSGDYIHSSFGPQPTIFDVMPTYPDPSTGIGVFLSPNDHLQLNLGVFDGRLVEGVGTGALSFDLGGPYWIVAEIGLTYTLSCRHDGRLIVGGWGHTYDEFDKLDGSGTQNGQAGFYVFMDQVLWLECPSDDANEQGIRIFISYGLADDDVNTFPQAITAGLTWTGVVPRRDDDIAAIGVAWGQFSDNDPSHDEEAEVAVEFFYRIGLTPNFIVQPVVQYIANPSGDSTIEDAWVGTVRVIAEF